MLRAAGDCGALRSQDSRRAAPSPRQQIVERRAFGFAEAFGEHFMDQLFGLLARPSHIASITVTGGSSNRRVGASSSMTMPSGRED
jgi:hypothetical protein